MTSAYVGLDFAAGGLRVAYSTPGRPVRFLGLVEPQWRWLLCEAEAADGLSVAFPSVKERLGRTAALGRVGGGHIDPFAWVVRALRAARRHVERTTCTQIATMAICVPSMYPEAQRFALKEAASEAGWSRVYVVNDAAAATMAYTGGKGSGHFLVYNLGYGSSETGLFRVDEGRYHALGHHAAMVPTGRMLDAQVLAACLTESQNGAEADADAAREEADWLGLRASAQQVKERLAGAQEEVAFPGRSVVFTQAAFEQRVRSCAAETRGNIDAVLGAAGESAALDAVLLVGGGTRMRPVRESLADLTALVEVPRWDLARGTLLHAQHLGGVAPSEATRRHASPLPLAAAAPAQAGFDDGGESEPEYLVPEEPGADRPTDESDSGMAVESPPPGKEPWSLQRARSALEQEDYWSAVSFAHLAWERSSERPEVFEAMIEIHCTAAAAYSDVEGFPDARRLLGCALRHDRGNSSIRDLLAQRCYDHSRELSLLGRHEEALDAVEECLRERPNHTQATTLRERLRIRTAATRSTRTD